MRMGSAVSLCACAVTSVYAHGQCRKSMRHVQCHQVMRIGSAVSLWACAVPSVYAQVQCHQLMRMCSAISWCACAVPSVDAHVQCRQLMRSAISLCACAVPSDFAYGHHCQFVRTISANDSEHYRQFMRMRTTMRIHGTKIIYALLFQVVLYHASSERQLLASPLHQNRYSAVFLICCEEHCCGSGMFIPDLGSEHCISIPDPGSKRSWKLVLIISNFNPKNCF